MIRISFLFVFILNSVYGFNQTKVKKNIISLDSYQKEALSNLNSLRSKSCYCGSNYFNKQKPLRYNKKLEKAAAIHAKDIYERKTLSHTGRNGSKVQERIKQQSYNWQSYAEIIAEGYDTIEEVFNAWMKSPGHCKSIMGNYEEVGIFKYQDYWVVDFGTEKKMQFPE
jgi:uncharacterized protein YkwD